ncbi:MAG: hypothetical protein FJY99_05085 [Candidatus Sericytochromatia bacterium]|nr:hypothetical protein [Candidatus Tanganyikabacteria bacterium]
MTPVDWLPWLRMLALGLVAAGLVRGWRGASVRPAPLPARTWIATLAIALLPVLLVPAGPKMAFALAGWGAGSLVLVLALLIPVASDAAAPRVTALLSALPVALLAPWAGRPGLETGYVWAAAVVPAATLVTATGSPVAARLGLALAATGGAAHVLGRLVPEGLGWAWTMLAVAVTVWLVDRLPDRGKPAVLPIALAALTVPAGRWLLDLPPAACWATSAGALAAALAGATTTDTTPVVRLGRLLLAGGAMLLLVRQGGTLALAMASAGWVATGAETTGLLLAGAWWTRLMAQEHLDRSWLAREGVDLTHPYALAGLLAGITALLLPATCVGNSDTGPRALLRPLAAWCVVVALGGVLGLESAGAAVMGVMVAAMVLGSGLAGPVLPRTVGLLLGLVAVASLSGPAMVLLSGLDRPLRLAAATTATAMAAWAWLFSPEQADAAA